MRLILTGRLAALRSEDCVFTGFFLALAEIHKGEEGGGSHREKQRTARSYRPTR